MRAWLTTILVLPLNILLFIPAFVFWLAGERPMFSGGALLVVGLVLLALGFSLALWTMVLFHACGKGSPAPWNPPKKLVIAGPYRHVRNPMLSSVFIMQIAEILLLQSWIIGWIFVVFLLGNMFYFPLVEEKSLAKRFGRPYLEYKKNVPRYIPRLTPYRA